MKGWHSRLAALRDVLDRFAVLIALVVLLLLWELAVDLGRIPVFVLPAPRNIWASIVKNWSALLAHSWVTLLETLAGFGLSVVIGIPLAFFIVYSRIFDRIIYPMLVASQAVPKVALAPILLVALGYGIAPKIIVAFLIAFFPVVINTAVGLTQVDEELLDLGRVFGAPTWKVFLKIRLTNALPYVLSALKITATAAVVGAVVGEFVASQAGLGMVIVNAQTNLNTPVAFAALVWISIVGLVLYGLVGLVARWWAPWAETGS